MLIVEDEFLTADNIKEYLIDLGHVVKGIARDAEEAIKLLGTYKIDMAILDLNIQGVRDGIWLASYIREHYQIPFIFLTAYSDEWTVKSAVETKPFGYLVKPFTKMNLYTTLEVARENFIQITQQDEAKNEPVIPGQTLEMEDYLFIKEKNGHSKVLVGEIAYAL